MDKSARRRRRVLQHDEGNINIRVLALSPEALMAAQEYHRECIDDGVSTQGNNQLTRRSVSYSRSGVPVGSRVVYVCPEQSCVHHHWSRGLSDLAGMRKHFYRKHGAQRRWKCAKCGKAYAVQCDWKAHTKVCENRQFVCDFCGLQFMRKDTFSKHKDYCQALARERAKVSRISSSDHESGNFDATACITAVQSGNSCEICAEADHVAQYIEFLSKTGSKLEKVEVNITEDSTSTYSSLTLSLDTGLPLCSSGSVSSAPLIYGLKHMTSTWEQVNGGLPPADQLPDDPFKHITSLGNSRGRVTRDFLGAMEYGPGCMYSSDGIHNTLWHNNVDQVTRS